MHESEIAFIDRNISYMKGSVLDIGSSIKESSQHDKRGMFRGKDYHGIDMEMSEGVDEVINITKESSPFNNKFNTVLCNSVLEHVDKPWVACDFIKDSVSSGGVVYISVPFVWKSHLYPSDYWRFHPNSLDVLFPWVDWIEKKFAFNGVKGFYSTPDIKKKHQRKGFLPQTMLHAIGYAE